MNDFTPVNRTMKERSRKLRKEMTRQDAKLWYEYLHTYKPRFRRQHVIGAFILDFYCDSARLAIELDGSQHYTDVSLKYDAWRTKKIEEKDITVLRFTNLDISRKFSDICTYIDYVVKKRLKELGK